MINETITPRTVALGVVTYNPNKSLLARLGVALSSGFILYVFDNSPTESIIRDFCTSHENCKYFTCGKNVGLGFGISSVCAEAYYDSYPALIFFDQDTVFDRSTLDFIEDFYICNFSITHNYSAIVFNSKNIDCVGTGEGNNKFIFKDVLISINSGSLYFLENLKKINWHNETYFVDGVDYEFCLNSNNNNLKIGECSQTPGFDHEAEQGSIKYKICNRLFSTRVYSLTRIIDATVASLRLLIKSIKTMNFSFALKISRLLTGYFAHQLIARIVNCSSSKKECLNGFKRKI